MSQGKIVEYIDQGNFMCSLCLEDKGNKLHLLTLSNRELNLSPKRALLISETPINIFFRMVRRRQACATASIPQLCDSFPTRI